MARGSFSFGQTTVGALTQKDVARLSRQNTLQVREGDRGYILAGTKIYSRPILDEDGNLKYTKDNQLIRELSTLLCVIRENGDLAVGKVTLSWLAGDDLFKEEMCPLELCKDNVRKYAATWKLTKCSTRDFSIDFYDKMEQFDHDIAFVAGKAESGFRAPSFDEIWQLERGSWVNKPEIKDLTEIKMQAITRRSLYMCTSKLQKAQRKELERLLAAAHERLVGPATTKLL